MVAGVVSGTIEWTTDPDFGYQVATSVPGVSDSELLQPRRLYERQGRLDEYDEWVARLKQERRRYLEAFSALDPGVLAGL